MTDTYDLCVVGAGLVGLSVARAFASLHEGASILIIDKEDEVAAHQSGHNSGVVHSGLYYRPGSLKARLCVEGREAIYDLSAQAGVSVERTGKLVIATDPGERDRLDELERRGRANGLRDMVRMGTDGILEIEPAATGIDALFVPDAGIVDYPALARHMANDLSSRGATMAMGAPVTAIDHRDRAVDVVAGDRRWSARALVNCAGLQSDRIARLADVNPRIRIVPFRGEYYELTAPARRLVRNLIYPVPDPRFPFLGVHFTRRTSGSIEVGPNAVLALGREQYRGVRPSWRDVRETMRYRGFRRLARRTWREGLREMVNTRSRRRYAALARRLVPDVRPRDLTIGGAGIRAQAVGRDGALIDDFVIDVAGSSVHVLNAPSPGATASLAIGRHVVERILPRFSV